jgi:PAS domain S-box-containing protein
MASDILDLNIFEQKFRSLFNEAPFSAALLSGDNFIVEMANAITLDLWGKDSSIIGKPLLEGMPEIEGQEVYKILCDVYRTGVTYEGQEHPAQLQKNGELKRLYVNLVYKAIKDNNGKITGVFAVGYDVTVQVESRRRLQESETRARVAIESTGMGTFQLDYNTGETTMSDRFNEIFGYGPGAKHQDYIRIVHPDDLEVRRVAHQKALDTGKLKYEIRIIREDRSIRWIVANGSVIYDENGKPGLLVGTVLDVTDEKLLFQKLEKSEMELKFLADSMAQLVWIAKGDGSVIYYNKRVFEFAGIKRGLDGTWVWEGIVHPDDLEVTTTAWTTAVSNQTPYVCEHRLMMLDGSFRWHLSRAYVYPTDDGARWYGTATDVHDQKILEMGLENVVLERTLALQRSNDDLQQFAHVASHDLKEPVRKIKTFTYKLQDEYKDVLGDRGNNFVNKIISASDRMNAMINGVLNYASLPGGANAFERVDLNSVIQNVQSDLEILIQEKKAVIAYDELPSVNGIKDLLHQLFYNLINNALKFSREDVTSTVSISHRVTTINFKDFHEILVSDNGIGFDQHYADEIFTSFYRLNSKDQYEGSGLGLALCKKIVERHNGIIEAKGEKGKGAGFFIFLPK